MADFTCPIIDSTINSRIIDILAPATDVVQTIDKKPDWIFAIGIIIVLVLGYLIIKRGV